jgi:hypothetical protein
VTTVDVPVSGSLRTQTVVAAVDHLGTEVDKTAHEISCLELQFCHLSKSMTKYLVRRARKEEKGRT